MMEDGNISDEDQNLFAEDDRYDDDAAREEEEERNNPDDYAVEVPASGKNGGPSQRQEQNDVILDYSFNELWVHLQTSARDPYLLVHL